MVDNAQLPTPKHAIGRPPKGKEKVNVLEAWKLRIVNKMSYQQIADHYGCHASHIHRTLRKLNQFLPDEETAQAYSDTKAAILTGVEHRLLASLVDPSKIEKASLNNIAFAFRQVADQLRLERGQSTSNVSVIERILDQSHDTVYKDNGQNNRTIEVSAQEHKEEN